MNEDKIKLDVIAKAEIIAKAIRRGNDVEIRKTSSGVSVTEISKRVLAR